MIYVDLQRYITYVTHKTKPTHHARRYIPTSKEKWAMVESQQERGRYQWRIIHF